MSQINGSKVNDNGHPGMVHFRSNLLYKLCASLTYKTAHSLCKTSGAFVKICKAEIAENEPCRHPQLMRVIRKSRGVRNDGNSASVTSCRSYGKPMSATNRGRSVPCCGGKGSISRILPNGGVNSKTGSYQA